VFSNILIADLDARVHMTTLVNATIIERVA